MGIGTLLGYLIGVRSAILKLAGHPRAWLIGLVFVLSARVARVNMTARICCMGRGILSFPWPRR